MEPVTDEIAPEYSRIVASPMCFKMMLSSDANDEYDNFQQFGTLNDYFMLIN
jgi:hypothetical protein